MILVFSLYHEIFINAILFLQVENSPLHNNIIKRLICAFRVVKKGSVRLEEFISFYQIFIHEIKSFLMGKILKIPFIFRAFVRVERYGYEYGVFYKLRDRAPLRSLKLNYLVAFDFF